MRHLGPVKAATLVVAAFFAISARADDAIAVLRSQLEQVKALVADMESRLAELQARGCAAPSTAHAADTPPVCTAPAAAIGAAPVTAPVAQARPPAGAGGVTTVAPPAAATEAVVPAAAAAPAASSPGTISAPAATPAPGGAQANATASTSVSSAPPPATPAGEVPRAAWREVHDGLSQDDVQRLLGPPTRTFDLPGRKVWYYVYPEHGAGSVFFDTSGKVSSEQAPTRW